MTLLSTVVPLYSSVRFNCPHCGLVSNKLQPITSESETTRQEMRDLAAQLSMQAEQKNKSAAVGAAAGEASDNGSSAVTALVSDSRVSSSNPSDEAEKPSQTPSSPPQPQPQQQVRVILLAVYYCPIAISFIFQL